MSKIMMRCFLCSLLACSIGLGLRGTGIAAPTLSVYQFTQGAPDGSPPGNPFLPGSATGYVGTLTTALNGTLVSRSNFTPQEATVWGPSGRFGGELYFMSVVQGISRGALLEEHKALFFTRPGQSEQTQFNVTYYFPMAAYNHTPSTSADGFTRLHFDSATGPGLGGTAGSASNGSLRTFASFGSVAADLSDGNGFAGTANHPPSAINDLIGASARYEATYRVIEGAWSLLGEDVSSRGFSFGTGFTDLFPNDPLAITALGSISVSSVIGSAVPEPATLILFSLGICGLIGYRWRSHRQAV
ncbi:MAG TPA: PEP-CTERM sorting domain-containing protein [Candidatus Saccharimonadia bacterium]|nr:PEP-CTERM sorting domain-containing protein [Candidatus Saccharimonadia bacterium]